MIIQLSNISFSYGNLLALNDVSLSIEGGAVGLLGPNGAGKTTLIRTLLGFLKPDSGSGEVLDMDIREETDLSIVETFQNLTQKWRQKLVQRLAKRPEGFVADEQLIPGQDYAPLNAGKLSQGK